MKQFAIIMLINLMIFTTLNLGVKYYNKYETYKKDKFEQTLTELEERFEKCKVMDYNPWTGKGAHVKCDWIRED